MNKSDLYVGFTKSVLVSIDSQTIVISLTKSLDSEHYTDQIAEMLWWPKPNAWGNGGLNIGYWSADCESWYQRRLETIRAAKVQLRSGAEWRQALRLQKKARGLVHSYEQAATLFLQGHHFH